MERHIPMIAPALQPESSLRRMRRFIKRRSSFTLVELLVVMGIVGILMAIAVPAVTGMLESSNMNRAAQQVADQINLAKQMSSAKNTTVELRMFKLSGATTSGFTEIQLGTNSTTGLWVALNRASVLPQNIAISENTTLSSAFYGTSALTMTNVGPTLNSSYRPIEFRPNGIVTPGFDMSTNCLAVVPSRYASTTYGAFGAPIKNYAVIQINPMTATPLIFRP